MILPNEGINDFKNVKTSLTKTEWETIKAAKMFEEQDINRCHVGAFELYKGKSVQTLHSYTGARNCKPGKK